MNKQGKNNNHKLSNSREYGLHSFMNKNKLNYLCVDCDISITYSTYYNHATHRISIKESSEYILLKLEDYYNNIKKLTKELNTIFDIIKECCLHVIDSRNNITYIVLPQTFDKKISYEVNSIPAPFDKDSYITYKNKYDRSITIQLLEKQEIDKEQYKQDLQYIYLYSLNRLRLYSYVNSDGILQFNDSIVWLYVSQLKNSYLIQLGLKEDKWYEFIASKAIEYLREEWKDKKDEFYALYNNLNRITKALIEDTDNKFNKNIERKNKEKISDTDNTPTNIIDLNKVGLKKYLTDKVDISFKAYLNALVKLYLYGNNANVSLRTISLISGVSFPSVQKYTKLLIDTKVIYDRTDNYKFTEEVLQDIKNNNSEISEIETVSVQNIETYNDTLTLYKKDWKTYYSRVMNFIRDHNPKEILKDILKGILDNNLNIINRQQILIDDQEYIHKPYIYNLVVICKSVLASIDSGVCNTFVKTYYGKVKSLLLAVNKRLAKNKGITEGINYGMLLRNNVYTHELPIGYDEQEYLMHIVRSIIIHELKVVKRWSYMRRKIPQNILEELDERRSKFCEVLRGKEWRLDV